VIPSILGNFKVAIAALNSCLAMGLSELTRATGHSLPGRIRRQAVEIPSIVIPVLRFSRLF